MRPISLCASFLCLLAISSNLRCQENALDGLRGWLATKPSDLNSALAMSFATATIDRRQAELATELLWQFMIDQHQSAMKKRIEEKSLVVENIRMPWLEKRFGSAPPTGHALFISMHGGGGAPPAVNDRQWQNQIKLYEPSEGIVVAPRAPTDTWNLWHQAHIDRLFDELIASYAIAEGIDTSRVYLMGYSAGGDGVYQLAPRMADRFAAACMMAGHPNETQPEGLRNLPFAIFMGGKDSAYKRNEVAGQWAEKLAALKRADPSGYEHLVKIYADKGHWMGGNDREGIPWMSTFRRREFPDRIVWRQDDVAHDSFYWIALQQSAPAGSMMIVEVRDNTVSIQGDASGKVTLWLSDQLINLDLPVTVKFKSKLICNASASRSIGNIIDSLNRYRDPKRACAASIQVSL